MNNLDDNPETYAALLVAKSNLAASRCDIVINHFMISPYVKNQTGFDLGISGRVPTEEDAEAFKTAIVELIMNFKPVGR